jgi:hypothetical protein
VIRPVAAVAALLVAGITLVACSIGKPIPPEQPRITAPPPAGDCVLDPPDRREPVTLTLPGQATTIPITRLGLTPEQDIDLVPLDRAPAEAGWYCWSLMPGGPGPTVLVGHVDWAGQLAAFGRIAQLDAGQKIQVASRSGEVLTYLVDRHERVAKASFPFDEVYGASPDSRLVLITCGGPFDHTARTYIDSDIVFAHLAP